MNVTTFALSELGSRQQNDDACADKNLMAGRCIVVADGAGGQFGGGIASRIVVDTVMLRLAAVPQWDEPSIVAAVDAASHAVHERQRQERALREMSSTLVLLCLDMARGIAHWTHLGDSRLYHFRQLRGERLTRDHSVVQSFLDAGLAGVVDTPTTVPRGVLYAAIGAEGEMRPVVGTKLGIRDGDAFLLCTDGVWDSVPDDELERCLATASSVREWVESIRLAVKRARNAAQDNYTAVAVWIGTPTDVTVMRVP